jgi:hypothetical protein
MVRIKDSDRKVNTEGHTSTNNSITSQNAAELRTMLVGYMQVTHTSVSEFIFPISLGIGPVNWFVWTQLHHEKIRR